MSRNLEIVFVEILVEQLARGVLMIVVKHILVILLAVKITVE